MSKRFDLQQSIFNFNWLLLDRIFQLFIGIFVGAWVARYLGPEQYGTFNYCIAYVSLFSVLSILGLNKIVVRNLVTDAEHTNAYLGVTALLKLVGSLVLFIVVIVSVSIIKKDDFEYVIYIAVVALAQIFKVCDVLAFWFQAKVKSKYEVMSHLFSSTIIALAKIAFILTGASLIFFVWTVPVNILIFGIGLVIFFQWKSGESISNWKIELPILKSLLKDSWPLALASVAVIIYTRIDQVMIGEMLNDSEIGKYSVAVRLSEIWYFFPTAIGGSIFPPLLRTRRSNKEKYLLRLQTIFDVFIWLGIFAAIVVMLVATPVIEILFGQAYLESAPVLAVHIWSAVFIFINTASGQYLIAENLTYIAFFGPLIAMLTNVGLNLLLIPRIGIIGAAYATMCAQAAGGILACLAFKRSRLLIVMMINSFNPLRLVRLFLK